MKDKSEQTMGGTPSLLTEARQGETKGSVSILRDLDPHLARLDSARRHSRSSLVPVGAALLVGSAALLWLFSSAPFDSDEPAPLPLEAEPPPVGATAEAVAEPPLPGEPTAMTDKAAPAPPSSQDQPVGPAVIFALPNNPPPEQANPLKALTLATGDVPGKPKASPPPAKPTPAPARKPTESKPIQAESRPKGNQGAAKASSNPVSDKTPEPPNGHLVAESKPKEAPKETMKPVSQRDVDIITAIVKDK